MILDDRSSRHHGDAVPITCRETETRGQERCERQVRDDRVGWRADGWIFERVRHRLARMKRNVAFPQADEAAFPKCSNLDRAEESCT